MKKILSKIGHFFGSLLAATFTVCLGLCFVLLLPLDYIKYKRSFYYKVEHKKYRLFAGSGIYFDIYNEIIKNDLPIKYIYNPHNNSLEHGWFVYQNTLIIPNVCSFEYNSETEKWNYCYEALENDDTERMISVSLDAYMETEIQEANELAGSTICDKAIILIDANCIENVPQAKKENSFLVYDDNMAEALRSYCNITLN